MHVGRENKGAKFWLRPVRNSRAGGFQPTSSFAQQDESNVLKAIQPFSAVA
ncbi:MAG: hypothetical protein KJZ95_00935 [Caldilinea sp.]|nr:hypothetical protein [Caldilinea sp.]